MNTDAETEAMAASVLAADSPVSALGERLAELDAAQRPEAAAALYESLCYRLPIEDYWLHFRMWGVYRRLGPAREDAAFLHAAAAARLHPDWSGADQLFRDLFRILVRRGQDRAALDLFRHQMRFQPDLPAANAVELAPVLRRLGEPAALAAPPPPPPDPGGITLHRVVAEEARAAWTCPVFGGAAPYAVAKLAIQGTRPAIGVAELTDAEVLIHRNSVVVLDRTGTVVPEFCVGDHPLAIRDWLLARERAGQALEAHAADAAVVISDMFPAPNICHFLYDQISRLDLYRRVGVEAGRVLVVGPEPGMPAQHEILRRAGVGAYLGTGRSARLRARRLWVSSNCRGLVHPGHLGARWAVDYARAVLGGQGTRGWRRLYISRADAAGRRVANEAAVLALLEPHGFEAIVPGRMGYEAQLAAFKQASHVVGPHGAALTHLVLCPPGAKVLELFHPLYGTYAYAAMAMAGGVDYAALLARDWASDAPEWNDPAGQQDMANRFGDRHMRVPEDALAAWLATAL